MIKDDFHPAAFLSYSQQTTNKKKTNYGFADLSLKIWLKKPAFPFSQHDLQTDDAR